MTSKLPFGGELVQLGDLCELVLGQSPSSESYNTVGKGLPFYQGNADFGKDHPSPKTWCTDPKKVAEPGDILISVRAPIGAINTAVERCCIGRGVAAIRPNADVANPEFLKFQLIAHRTILEAQGTGSTFKAVGKKVLSEHPVTLYPMDVQKELARHFASIISCIGVADAQLSVLSSLVKSRFVEMFGDQQEFLELQSLTIPKSKISYGIVQPGQDGTGDMGVLRPVDIVDGRLELVSIKRIDSHIGDSYKRTELTGDEVLTVVRGATGQTVKSIPACKGMNVTRGIAVIRYDKTKVNPDYLVAYMNSDEGQRYIGDHTQGATLKQINISDLKVMPIPVPALDMQQKFAVFAEQVDKSRVVAQKQKETLQTLYDSLAQEYFAI